MSIFLTANDLNAALEHLFESAEDYLILISPYIKLHERFTSVLRTKIDNPDLRIIIVFGKNENDFSKSMKQEDFNFFKSFPNIEIRHEKRLHAKYYANQGSAILTSMNLYDFSQDTNIEAGVLTIRKGLLGSITNGILTNVTGQDTLENQAEIYFDRVIEQSEMLFNKVPIYESTNMGLSKRYNTSEIKTDKLSDFFNSKSTQNNSYKHNSSKQQILKPTGYCIRTGVQIPFNPQIPMSDTAYESWNKYRNNNYPEKYCHFSGETSNKETTFLRPILGRNWNKAKAIHKL
jgi:hypothetical protein